MTVFPADGGRPVIKSSPIWDHGCKGTGKGRTRLAGGELPDLVWAQTAQEAIKRRASRSNVGHQKRWRIEARVPRTPGWADNFEECPHWRTAKRAVTGTNRRCLGQARGTVTRASERLTNLSIPQTAAPATQAEGIISSWVVVGVDESKRRERMSGLTFFDPGRYEMEKLKRVKNRAQRA